MRWSTSLNWAVARICSASSLTWENSSEPSRTKRSWYSLASRLASSRPTAERRWLWLPGRRRARSTISVVYWAFSTTMARPTGISTSSRSGR
jgi:hypothetical protein